MKKSAYTLVILLMACQPGINPTSPGASQRATSLRVLPETAVKSSKPADRKHYPALSKFKANGNVTLRGQTLTLKAQFPPLESFNTKKLDLSHADKIIATVTDSHGKSYTPVGADGSGKLNYPVSGVLELSFTGIVPDALLFVNLQVENSSTHIPQANLATVLKQTGTADVSTALNFQTGVAAQVLQTLLGSNATRARSLDLTALHTFTASITGVSGTAPNLTYAQNHPTLVNTHQLATDLISSWPGDLTASDYRQSGATVAVTVSGLSGGDQVQLQLTDAATEIATGIGNGSTSLTGATPGSGLQLQVTPFGAPSQNYSYHISPATLTLTEGATTHVTVTASPVLNVSGFSPTAGAVGTPVTINGDGFTGTSAVTVGGASATFSVVNDNQISVTVPANAVEGVISVTNGGATVNSASSFDVQRRIYVNDDASGSNNGTSWANAYPSLQDALTAAGANDEIWIAAGTYTPHASDRTVSFQMKENVNIYGGFAGTESALGDRTASLTDFVTVLSGDLTGNDNYSTPGTTLDENSYHVTQGASNAILDGVTIRGGYANGTTPEDKGAGMYNTNVEPTLTNLTFANNTATVEGGGLYNFSSGTMLSNVSFSSNSAAVGGGVHNFSSAATLNNVSFLNNSANINGGGMSISGSTATPTLNNVSFSNNSANSNGGGMVISGGIVATTLNNVSFSNNSANEGGGLYNFSSDTMLSNVSFSSNSAVSRGGGLYNSNSDSTLTNIIFSNNSTTGSGGGIYNTASDPTLTNLTFANNTATDNGDSIYSSGASAPIVKNVLFYNNTRFNIDLDAPNGVIEASSDPFVDSANPLGADGIPMTADDGLRIASAASTVINQGVTGANVPATDILGNARVGNPEPGAYEYLPPPPPANVLVVKHNATGANDGSSWSNAFTDLQSALTAADGVSKNEIWIAEGTYTPHASDRTASFQMKENVNMYGGFAGTESALGDRTASRTDFVTILSGDLSGNDNYTTPGNTLDENSYHVTIGANNAILDGVTIRGGYANEIAYDRGGGMKNSLASPVISHVIFDHNFADKGGGMFNNTGSSPSITHTIFSNNRAFSEGGGMHNNILRLYYDIYPLHPPLNINQVTFFNNSADEGGGIYNDHSDPVLSNVIFFNNSASTAGGAMVNENSVALKLSNITFANNTAVLYGSGVANIGTSNLPNFTNLLFWNNSLTGQGLDAPNGVIEASSDPFVNSANPFGADGIPMTADDGLRIAPTASAVINQGVTGANVPATDILGNNHVGNPEPGAYEYLP